MAPEPKQLFRNNTFGWIGVVLVGPTGQPEGAAVEAGGTIFLTEQEARLTAHAPRAAADNPFLEQTYEARDPETGETGEVKITPLTIVEDDRPGPGHDRYVPSEIGTGVGVSTAPGGTPAPPLEPVPAGIPAPEASVTPPPPPPVPPGVQAAIDNAERQEAAKAAKAEEEHAALATPEGEETGAAVPPQGSAPEGEYARNEEVGTPDAPAPYVEEVS